MAAERIDEKPQNSQAVVEEVTTEAEQADRPHFEPKGAFAFVLILLLGYAIYFALVYFEVFVARGA